MLHNIFKAAQDTIYAGKKVIVPAVLVAALGGSGLAGAIAFSDVANANAGGRPGVGGTGSGDPAPGTTPDPTVNDTPPQGPDDVVNPDTGTPDSDPGGVSPIAPCDCDEDIRTPPTGGGSTPTPRNPRDMCVLMGYDADLTSAANGGIILHGGNVAAVWEHSNGTNTTNRTVVAIVQDVQSVGWSGAEVYKYQIPAELQNYSLLSAAGAANPSIHPTARATHDAGRLAKLDVRLNLTQQQCADLLNNYAAGQRSVTPAPVAPAVTYQAPTGRVQLGSAEQQLRQLANMYPTNAIG